MQQDEAFNLLKMGKNIFLTGATGAGKTYLLNKSPANPQGQQISTIIEQKKSHQPCSMVTLDPLPPLMPIA